MPATTTAKLRTIASTAPIDEILSIVRADGGVIVKGLLTPDQVARFNAEIDPALRGLDAGSKHDNEIVAEFHGRNTKRLTNLVTRSETFRREVIDHDPRFGKLRAPLFHGGQ